MAAGVDNVITVRFAEPPQAYRALVSLKELHVAGGTELRGAIVVERTESGGLRLPEDPDMVAGINTGGGTLIGMLMDILGGPLGMLLGWGGAALIGAAVDLRMARQSGPLGHFSTTVRLGRAAVVADLTETDIAIVDAAMAALEGEVVRRPADLVLAELAAAEEASTAAAMEAHRVLREQHKAERRADQDARLRQLKDQLGRGY